MRCGGGNPADATTSRFLVRLAERDRRKLDGLPSSMGPAGRTLMGAWELMSYRSCLHVQYLLLFNVLGGPSLLQQVPAQNRCLCSTSISVAQPFSDPPTASLALKLVQAFVMLIMPAPSSLSNFSISSEHDNQYTKQLCASMMSPLSVPSVSIILFHSVPCVYPQASFFR